MTAPKKTATKKTVAAKAEALEEGPTTFEHAGITFEVPHPLDFPLEVLETDDEFEACRLIVGEDQWKAYKETRPTIRDFGVFAEKLSAAQGRDTNSGN
ncbi:hypothetical protein [Streptomyces sp. H27-H5]|uniref:hypothetical protein n=1 Tax=Streptomyces sp. H27-H5 TaxID=2996460 RepID=UPI00226FE332|nr:hypothetical protein [Streptomyces sp. H27-H5]MCY0962734.1 hypothetical protein [Streptomyces sp. H27-H5]